MGWYARPLDIYATHGFVTIFPHIKGPIQDQNSSTTENDGTSLKKGIAFATAAQSDESSPLYGMVDLDNVSRMPHCTDLQLSFNSLEMLVQRLTRVSLGR